MIYAWSGADSLQYPYHTSRTFYGDVFRSLRKDHATSIFLLDDWDQDEGEGVVGSTTE